MELIALRTMPMFFRMLVVFSDVASVSQKYWVCFTVFHVSILKICKISSFDDWFLYDTWLNVQSSKSVYVSLKHLSRFLTKTLRYSVYFSLFSSDAALTVPYIFFVSKFTILLHGVP